MNYRHQFHAGNFADVVKHALLVQLVRALQQKPRGFLYLDTHAGRGAYDLAAASVGDSLARTPEWPDGIGRLWDRTDAPPPVAGYLQVLRAFDAQQGNLQPMIRFYPGSPWIVRLLARPEDRLALCEKHPAEFGALKDDFNRARARGAPARFGVHEMDGYGAMRAMLPPAERRGLVLIDPPYEAQDEFAQATDALREALRRFPAGVYATWYPLTERARVHEFMGAIKALNPPPTLMLELAVAGDASELKLKGCGLFIINPPWRFEVEAAATLAYLAPLLAQQPGATSRVAWVVPEK
jgi:23S rRNA (adenine2030-N6)-methyltransferase